MSGRWPSGLLLGLLLALVPWLAQAQPLLTHVDQRRTVSLDGDWHVIVDPYETGYYNYRRQPYDEQPGGSTAAFYQDHHAQDKQELVEYDFAASPTLKVPGDWNSQSEQLLYYEGTLWLQRSFEAPAARAQRRQFLHFGAVNHRADVWLNGRKLGVHVGGFTPFNFEVTALLRPGANSLVVKVDNTRHAEAVPTVSTDWWNYGGITREVRLIDEPRVFVQDFSLQLKKGQANTLAGFVQLGGAGRGEAVTLRLPELGLARSAAVDDSGRAAFEFEAPAALQRWSPRSPKLYEVEVATAHQTLREQIGFRSIEVRGSEILLNGEPQYLRGISIHEENPLRGGRSHSEADALQALGWARELGCNYVRLAHYPHNEHMLRLADRLGLMVWEEIPVYWTIAFGNPATLANAKQQLGEMIVRDRDHASVLIWSVANETPPGEARNAFLGALIDHARRLDDTRLISAALETHDENGVTVVDDRLGERLDVVAFNQYRGWYGGSLDDAPEARWEVRFDKPVIISEFGGDALQGRHGPRDERWTEEYQEYLYQQNLRMIEAMPKVRGMSPWILADFRSPRRVLPGIQDGYNRKGLISSQGVKKKAFFTLREFYRQKQAQHP